MPVPMISGRSIERTYRDEASRRPGPAPSSFRQLWLVGVLVVGSLLWSGAARVHAASAERVSRPQAAAVLAGMLVSLPPARILDTRRDLGVPGPVAASTTVALQVLGQGGVPVDGVSAVVLNLTVTGPTRPGFITAYAHGAGVPPTSSLNFGAGQTIANLAVVPVGADGSIALRNGSAGTVNLLGDVSGYYLRGVPAVPGAFGAVGPSRLLDTRVGLGAARGPVGGRGSVAVQLTGAGGVPATGVSAVVVNITAVGSTAAGFVTAYADGAGRPNTSNLNFGAGAVVAGLAVVPIGNDGEIRLYNGSPGSVQLLVDVAGYYRAGVPATPGSFQPLAPARILDTRLNLGAPGPVAGRSSIAVQVLGTDGIPATNVSAVVVNLTAVGPTGAGYLTAFADGSGQPATSNLNFTAGAVVPNLAVVPVGSDGKVRIFNGATGTVHILADVAGYYLTGSPTSHIRLEVGAGTVIGLQGATPCTSTCSADVDTGSELVLAASAASGWTFERWSGVAGCGATPQCTFTVTGDTTVTADFAQIQEPILLHVNGSGSVNSCRATCTSTQPWGSTVSLIATPAGGWNFTGYTGDTPACGRSPRCDFVLQQPADIAANFAAQAGFGPGTSQTFATKLFGRTTVCVRNLDNAQLARFSAESGPTTKDGVVAPLAVDGSLSLSWAAFPLTVTNTSVAAHIQVYLPDTPGC